MPDSVFGSIEPAPSVVIAWPTDPPVLTSLDWLLLWTPVGAWKAVYTPVFQMSRRAPITPAGRPGTPSSAGVDLWWPGARCSDGVADAVPSERRITDLRRLNWSLSAEVTSTRLVWSLSAEVTSGMGDEQAIDGGDNDSNQEEPLSVASGWAAPRSGVHVAQRSLLTVGPTVEKDDGTLHHDVKRQRLPWDPPWRNPKLPRTSTSVPTVSES